jgi:hypothetical protein
VLGHFIGGCHLEFDDGVVSGIDRLGQLPFRERRFAVFPWVGDILSRRPQVDVCGFLVPPDPGKRIRHVDLGPVDGPVSLGAVLVDESLVGDDGLLHHRRVLAILAREVQLDGDLEHHVPDPGLDLFQFLLVDVPGLAPPWARGTELVDELFAGLLGLLDLLLFVPNFDELDLGQGCLVVVRVGFQEIFEGCDGLFVLVAIRVLGSQFVEQGVFVFASTDLVEEFLGVLVGIGKLREAGPHVQDRLRPQVSSDLSLVASLDVVEEGIEGLLVSRLVVQGLRLVVQGQPEDTLVHRTVGIDLLVVADRGVVLLVHEVEFAQTKIRRADLPGIGEVPREFHQQREGVGGLSEQIVDEGRAVQDHVSATALGEILQIALVRGQGSGVGRLNDLRFRAPLVIFSPRVVLAFVFLPGGQVVAFVDLVVDVGDVEERVLAALGIPLGTLDARLLRDLLVERQGLQDLPSRFGAESLVLVDVVLDRLHPVLQGHHLRTERFQLVHALLLLGAGHRLALLLLRKPLVVELVRLFHQLALLGIGLVQCDAIRISGLLTGQGR